MDTDVPDRIPPGFKGVRRPLVVLGLLLIVGSPALFHEHLDAPLGSDARFLTHQNAFMQDASGLREIWTADYFEGAETGGFTYVSGYYRPVANAFIWVVHRFAGADPLLYNLAEMLLHGVVSALVLLVLLRVGGDPVAAGVGAVIFAVHPVNAFAATEPAAVADVLFPVFYLLALVVFDRALRTDEGGRPWPFLIGATLLYGAALLSKEMGITLPAVLALLVVYRWRRDGRPLRRLSWTLPMWAVLGAYLVWRFGVFASPLHDLGYLERHGLVAVLAGQAKSVLIHAARIAVPLGPSYPELHPRLVNTLGPPAADPLAWAGAAVCLALLGGALLWRRRPLVAFWCGFFLVTYSPLLSVENIAGTLSGSILLAQERWVYLPAVGLLALAGHGAARAWRSLESSGHRRVAVTAAATGVALLAGSSFVHAGKDDDPYARLRRLYLFSEDELDRKQLANRYLLYAHWVAVPQGDLEEAEARARHALELVPDSPITARELASILARRKKWRGVERVLEPWHEPDTDVLARVAETNPRVYDDINRSAGEIAVLLGRARGHLADPAEGARMACRALAKGAPPVRVHRAIEELRTLEATPGELPRCEGLAAPG